jgi:hypothetical protein
MSIFRSITFRLFRGKKFDTRRSFAAFNSEGYDLPNNPIETIRTDPTFERITKAQSGLVGSGSVATRRKKDDGMLLPVVERNHREDVLRFKKQLIRAVQPMIQHNAFFDLYTQEQLGNEWLSIATPRGKFHIHYQPSDNCLMYISYTSGYHGYRYHPEENVWLSKKDDEHNMLGMITRDMIHHLGGCPDFNYPDLTEADYVMRNGNAVVDEEKIALQIMQLQLNE